MQPMIKQMIPLSTVQFRVMLLFMSVAVLDFPGMAKQEQGQKDRKPTDEVRFVAMMTREQRARFRIFCLRIGADMEKIGAQWILDRLAAEEKKLGK